MQSTHSIRARSTEVEASQTYANFQPTMLGSMEVEELPTYPAVVQSSTATRPLSAYRVVVLPISLPQSQ